MRVGQISSVYYSPRSKVCNPKNYSKTQIPEDTNISVNFKGKFGKIVGGAIGTGAVVAASMIAAPAIICLAGAGLVAGMVSGDVAEDKINKEGDYKNR